MLVPARAAPVLRLQFPAEGSSPFLLFLWSEPMKHISLGLTLALAALGVQAGDFTLVSPQIKPRKSSRKA